MNGQWRQWRIGVGLGLSGWVALAATALPASPAVLGWLRVLVVACFLVAGPGGAAVRAAARAPDRRGRGWERLEAAVLTVALSLSISAVVAEGFSLAHGFSSARVVGTLAAVTTALALLGHHRPRSPGRSRRPGSAPTAESGASAAGAGSGWPAEPGPAGQARWGWHPGVPRAGWPGWGLALGAGPGPQAGPGSHPGLGRRQAGQTRRGLGPRFGVGRVGRGVAGLALLVTAAACGGQGAPASSGPSSGSSRSSAASALALASAPAAPGPWHTVFQDDFNGTALDSTAWTTCYDWNLRGCTNGGNHELEWYQPGQVTVGGGRLSLTAQRRTTAGSDGHSYPWTSGMVSTGRDSWDATPRHTFTYGYFAASIQVPAGMGLFPAFWMMPQTRSAPPELDIAEFTRGAQSVLMTVHWAGAGGRDAHLSKRYGPVDFPAGYHVLALDWEPDSLTWYVDGVARFTTTAHVPKVPMEVLLDLAVGYPEAPPASMDSAVMKVDWVRVWQR
ncbi:family 16 glycosylhydrolase [Streptacidiphilus sp. N1-12]|uniref:Family 16 glycosylhydrolase n=2 Tax=Streptacidiphilus alkalitolerans TaxID=3342712 RepID=A0ABV6V2X2_9ACTN